MEHKEPMMPWSSKATWLTTLVVATASCFGIAMAAVAPIGEGEDSSRDPLRNIILVRAKATDTQKEITHIRAIFLIEHVYCGPDELRGRSFSLLCPLSGQSSTGHDAIPPPKVGEVGIWPLRVDCGDALSLGWFPNGRTTFPARKGLTPRYEEAVKLAQAVEQVWDAEPVKRPGILREFVSSVVPEIANWSVRALAVSHPDTLSEMSNDVETISRVTIAGQTALDEVLVKIEGRPWISSKARGGLIQGWVERELSEPDAFEVISRLDVISRRSEADREVLLGLIRTLAGNSSLTAEARTRAQHIIIRLEARTPPPNH